MNDQYFAIRADVDELMSRVESYYQRLYDLGQTQKIQKSHYYHYGQGGRTAALSRSGVDGERTDIAVNDFNSLNRHVVTLVTANRRSYKTRATNTDYKSQVQTILGDQIVDYYLREKKLERWQKQCCAYAVKYSEGFIVMDWDVKGGDVYTVDEMGNPVNEGDIAYRVKHPLEVPRDVDKEGEQDWYIVMDVVNKYDLASRYPEHTSAILDASVDNSFSQYRAIDHMSRTISSGRLEDMCPVYTFYHRKCNVLPEGKLVIFIEGTKLLDGPLSYSDVPVYRMAPENLDGTCLGYTNVFDLLSLEEATDKLYSAVVSNNVTFARQCVQGKPDANLNVQDLGDGLKYIETESEIKPVQLTASAPETYNLIDTLTTKKQTLTGINEVIQGNPDANLRSGNALALVAAQALTYNSNLEQSYNELFEDVGTATLRFLRDFARSPRFIAIVGKYKSSYMKQFVGEQLNLIDRVTIEPQSAVAATLAGKIELATNLLQNKLIDRPDQYLMVLETGRLDALTEGKQAEILLVRSENERMADGQPVQALTVDKHDLHIMEHKSVLANPETRMQPQIVAAVLQHIQEHIFLLQNLDPVLAAATGNQVLGPPPPPPGQQGAPAQDVVAPPQPANGEMPQQPDLPAPADELSQQAYGKLQQMQQQ
jgi:hypothetical protein